MEASKLIVWFLGISLLICLALVGAIALRGGAAPVLLDHIATATAGGLAGAMSIKTTPNP
jgi:hypothetical protein